MCHRRHHTQRRRLPLIILLGKLAYDKYQSRQASCKDALASDSLDRTRSPSPEKLSLDANAEVLEKTGLASPPPPPYDDAVVDVPSMERRNEKRDAWAMKELEENEEREDLSDDEEFFDVGPDGRRVLSREVQGAQERFVGKWKRRREMV